MGAMHMALLGPEGLNQLAVRNMTACLLAKQKLSEIQTIAIPHQFGHHFNEFVIELPGKARDCLNYLDSNGIIGGFDLNAWYPNRMNWLLITVTDQTKAEEIELLAAHLALWTSKAVMFLSNLFDHKGAIGKGYSQPQPLLAAHTIALPESLTRKTPARWPRLSEPEMVRHYTWLSKRNFGIDTGFYPLGSCTMKHNPRINEVIAQLPGIADVHPHQPEHHLQGLLSIFHEMQEMLEICSGMDQVTLQPVAGAQGEFTAVRCIQEYFRSRGETQRTKVIVPDSAHGTNPASAAMAGFEIVEIPSRDDGRIDLDAIRAVVDDETAVMMITNPNTLGLFEPEIAQAAEIVHAAGGQMYYDGANFNAILGLTSPGLMGFDAVHYNLHKTFSQPHGGGGPGSGPIGVKNHLAEFLPGPIVKKRPIKAGEEAHAIDDLWFGWYQPERSIGKVQQWHGNAGAVVRSWAFYRRFGKELRTMSQHAVLNANYLRTCHL